MACHFSQTGFSEITSPVLREDRGKLEKIQSDI